MEFEGSVLSECSDDETLGTDSFRQRMTLHCPQCNTVLGDSFSVCGEITSLDSILCLKVTNDVVVSDAMKLGHKGELADCIYSSLKCRGCSWAVGKVIHCAPSRLAAVRSIFLLHKANINCYILNSSSMVKASKVTFDIKDCSESMKELKQEFEARLDHMLSLKKRLTDRSLTSTVGQ